MKDATPTFGSDSAGLGAQLTFCNLQNTYNVAET